MSDDAVVESRGPGHALTATVPPSPGEASPEEEPEEDPEPDPVPLDPELELEEPEEPEEPDEPEAPEEPEASEESEDPAASTAPDDPEADDPPEPDDPVVASPPVLASAHMHAPRADPSALQTWYPVHPPGPTQPSDFPGVQARWVESDGGLDVPPHMAVKARPRTIPATLATVFAPLIPASLYDWLHERPRAASLAGARSARGP
jgi:hypothetical protein